MFTAMSEQPSPSTVALGVKGEVTTEELDRHERSIVRRSAESRAIVPSVEYAVEVGMEAALARAERAGWSVLALVIGAVAGGLRRVPRMNAAYRDGHYELYSRVNVGVLLAGTAEQATPVLFDTDARAASDIAVELADLTARAASGRLAPADTSGATFTLSPPLGDGVAISTPLIVPPQAGALAMGPVRETPVVRDGAVVAGCVMTLTLACDQRIAHASHASDFLAIIKADLEGVSR